MKLLTKEIIKKTPKIGTQANVPAGEAISYAKFFTPWGNWTWYLLELDSDLDYAFGYVEGFKNEYGYFSINELSAIVNTQFGGLKVERDRFFTPTAMKEIIKKQ